LELLFAEVVEGHDDDVQVVDGMEMDDESDEEEDYQEESTNAIVI
jgi:hypothetical protein